MSVLLGLGDGTFRPELRFAVGTNPTGLVAGDFDGDGRFDLAASQRRLQRRLAPARPRRRHVPQPRCASRRGDLPQALVTGDFNGDGRLDLATANYRSQDVSVFLGRGDGTFRDPVRLALGTAPISLAAADFNGDGRLDLVTANYLSDDVAVLLGQGTGPSRTRCGSRPGPTRCP